MSPLSFFLNISYMIQAGMLTASTFLKTYLGILPEILNFIAATGAVPEHNVSGRKYFGKHRDICGR